MIEKTIIVGPFQCNCRLFVCPRSGEAILVDPGDEAPRILSELQGLKTPGGPSGGAAPIQVKYLLQTHGHLDHIGATRSVFEALSCSPGRSPGQAPRIALHKADEPLYLGLKMQGNLFGIQYDDPLPIDHFLEDGEELRIGEMKLSVLHTPGHSPGSVCLRLHEDSSLGLRETVLSGDTLFQNSVGRTDLWGGNQDQMFKSIRQRLLVLDDDTRVCPGHGDETWIGMEKLNNPFLRS